MLFRYAAGFRRYRGRESPQCSAEQPSPEPGALGARLLECLGDLAGLDVLDACCGEGFLTRRLAARGARVTGIDISSRLLEIARRKTLPGGTPQAQNPLPAAAPEGADTAGSMEYRLADLSQPLPELAGRFDRIGSLMALNDVADYQGFASTLAALAKPGGRIALAFNNPYSFIMRGNGHITDYFAAHTHGIYGGMSSALGGTVRYYHRTLEQYLDAFLATGLRLAKLADVQHTPTYLPGNRRLPFFLVLAFDKP